MAARLHAEWVAVHVETPRDQRLTAAEREDILRALELAEQLGGRAVTLERAERRRRDPRRTPASTTSPASSPARPGGRAGASCSGGSLLDDARPRAAATSRSSPSAATEEDEAQPRPSPARSRVDRCASILAAARSSWSRPLIGLAVRRAGVTGPADRRGHALPAGRRGGVAPGSAAGPAVAAALVGIASFDFFFVHPFYTFSVADVRYVLTFGVMLVVALVMGNLTGRIRNQAEAAREREQRTSALYALSRELATARDRDARARRGAPEPARHVRAWTPAVSCSRTRPDAVAAVGAGALSARRAGAGRGAVELRPRAGGRTRHRRTLPGGAALYLPLAVVRPRRWASSGCRSRSRPGLSAIPARRRLLEALAGADRGRARAAGPGRAEPRVRGGGRGRAAPHRAAELAVARHAHAARLDRGRREHAAAGRERARPTAPGASSPPPSSRNRTAWGGWSPTCST